MVLKEIYPDVSIEEHRANSSWDINVSSKLLTTKPPTKEELMIIREELDPEHIHLR